MTKKEIHKRLIDQMTRELKAITAAARTSFATATDDAHRAEHKYDTFKLESSFLARGQAKRVEELTVALDSLQMLPLKRLRGRSPVQLGALVGLRAADGGMRTLLFGSAAGGETIGVDGEDITVVTSGSPLGQAVMGKTVGDRIEIRIGNTAHTYTVESVA
jgi:transcription elongation GreA/GreB family factor